MGRLVRPVRGWLEHRYIDLHRLSNLEVLGKAGMRGFQQVLRAASSIACVDMLVGCGNEE